MTGWTTAPHAIRRFLHVGFFGLAAPHIEQEALSVSTHGQLVHLMPALSLAVAFLSRADRRPLPVCCM